ncbi:unannotated protein [freshwater metagenome]|uniref:Unannotated protein n=1 Tax=freshwater metagenome TaxID=449393 RepID=A0A6J7PE81_9ZZZZ
MRPKCRRLPGPRATSSPLHYLAGIPTLGHRLDRADGKSPPSYECAAPSPHRDRRRGRARSCQFRPDRRGKQFPLHYREEGRVRSVVRHFAHGDQMRCDHRGLIEDSDPLSRARVHFPSLNEAQLPCGRADLQSHRSLLSRRSTTDQ